MWWESGRDKRAEEGCVRGIEEDRGCLGQVRGCGGCGREKRHKRREY